MFPRSHALQMHKDEDDDDDDDDYYYYYFLTKDIRPDISEITERASSCIR